MNHFAIARAVAIFVVALLFVPSPPLHAQTEGWNYIYHVHRNQCLDAAANDLTVGIFLGRHGCHIENTNSRDGTVMVINCKEDPDVREFVYFGRTLAACEWIKANYKP